MNLYKPGQKVQLVYPSLFTLIHKSLVKFADKQLTISYLLPLRFNTDVIVYKLEEISIAVPHIYLKPVQPSILTNRRTIK